MSIGRKTRSGTSLRRKLSKSIPVQSQIVKYSIFLPWSTEKLIMQKNCWKSKRSILRISLIKSRRRSLKIRTSTKKKKYSLPQLLNQLPSLSQQKLLCLLQLLSLLKSKAQLHNQHLFKNQLKLLLTHHRASNNRTQDQIINHSLHPILQNNSHLSKQLQSHRYNSNQLPQSLLMLSQWHHNLQFRSQWVSNQPLLYHLILSHLLNQPLEIMFQRAKLDRSLTTLQLQNLKLQK